ncbi:MAG TPA: hypothetical protein VM598_13870 [Bdellovibrionota bacterium]|nr:hypothetical protein [Bdellovibrionota bacterium]
MDRSHLMLAAVAFVATACGNPIDCAVNGDNLEGRITFGQGIPIRADAPLVIQYSTTSFATNGTPSTKTNPHGLPTVPYGFCVPVGVYQLRAFQDLNGNGSLDAGEPSGRKDDTTTGNASFVNQTILLESNGTYNRIENAEIMVDTP